MATRININCEINTYPNELEDKGKVRVKNHWQSSEKVVIFFDDKSVTVLGRDLITAIENCMNCGDL
tara:strand:+ start:1230 stop:1427 length:198 start_codon:yes stop_codon:yes gene_type:complete